ncbi:hypothetical protein [Rhizobium azibense]|uniref:Uncharacterized protein n=1 Tax=Rhizobium azibense TaxID=1136135 RepID=A0A4R3REV2_9HYPH|nr:hypothetical protein [Rhizobium azibense]TCU34063.1 hypothetical protein EV129_11346 [Rhizobium azibense]
MGYFSSRIRENLASPNGAYERAYELCERAVLLEQAISGSYKGEAIRSLSSAGEFGSWLRKLFHREKVTIHLHYYERLVFIVEELSARKRRQIDHIDDLIRIAKGRHNATDESDNRPGFNSKGIAA